MLPSGAFVRSLFNLQDTRPLLRNIHYFTTNALHCQELFQGFNFLSKAFMVAVLADSLFRIPLTRAFVKNFFRLFQTFSLRSPPLTSRRTACLLYHTPLSLSTTFFLIFNFFPTLCNPCQNPGLYLPCHRTLFLPLTFMIYYSYIGRMLDRVRHGVDSPKAFCFRPIPSTPSAFHSPAVLGEVCIRRGHDIHFAFSLSSLPADL